MDKPRLLVTRFALDAQRLANLLNSNDIFAIAQPLLAVKKSVEFNNVSFLFTNSYDYIIAISSNAVNYTHQALLGAEWPVSRYFAVGKTTQTALSKVTGLTVTTPKTQFTSEGLLELPCMKELTGKRILILRGVGGRELLAQKLTARGAIVDYYQPYQRFALNLNGALLVQEWQQQGINGAIISSGELLQRLLELVPENKINWLKALTIYVPSTRLAEQARLYGWNHVQVFPGVQDNQILNYFK
jgi:uroporphyrinogen-III synthase